MNKEFLVSDVFGNAKLGKYHNPNKLVSDANGYPYICATNFNNGINKDMPRVSGDELSLTPSKIIAWGKQCPMFCYHDEPCVTSQGMYYLDMSNYDENIALYVCGALTVSCGSKYNYTNCLIGKALDEEKISLPVIKSADINHEYTIGDIDWQYMQERISELEQERISELEQERISELDAYLKASGLDDYELTEEEQAMLEEREQKESRNARLKGFKVSDVFCINSSNGIFHAVNIDIYDDPVEGSHPYVVRTAQNNGIRGHIVQHEEALNPANTISFAQDTAEMFFRECPYFTGNKVKIFNLNDKKAVLNYEISMYLVAALKKGFSAFAWGSSFDTKLLNEAVIELPLIEGTEDEIDFEYMEKYIRAIEKSVIADVVKYKDSVIETTKRVAGR